MMPLYDPLTKKTKAELIKNKFFNTGLWYDKFCNTWHEVNESWDLGSYKEVKKKVINPKQDWLKTVTCHIGGTSLLEEACKRQRMLAEAGGIKECVQQFSTVWRFVTGLGRQHPVENGFAWHHTLGVPYLPGSSVKGLVRAWAEQWEQKEQKETFPIFGPKNGAASAGNVIFFDALPTKRVLLEEDVMTPHYTPYYQKGNDPGDWYDPVPIPFLTVADGQIFQFAVVPRSPRSNPQSIQDAKKVMEWLEQALACIGAGAKTAVGYGRFRKKLPASASSVSEIWQLATVRYTPNDGKFTVSNNATGAKAVCPESVQSSMKTTYKTLNKNRQKTAKGKGLPCVATVVVQGNQRTIQRITVTWTGEATETYGEQ